MRPGPSTRSSTQSPARSGQSSQSTTPTSRGRSWAGAYIEFTSALHVTIDLIASLPTDEHLQFLDIDHGTCKFIISPAGPQGLGTRSEPRLGQTHARPLPGPRSAPQPASSHGGRGDRRGRRRGTRLLPRGRGTASLHPPRTAAITVQLFTIPTPKRFLFTVPTWSSACLSPIANGHSDT